MRSASGRCYGAASDSSCEWLEVRSGVDATLGMWFLCEFRYGRYVPGLELTVYISRHEFAKVRVELWRDIASATATNESLLFLAMVWTMGVDDSEVIHDVVHHFLLQGVD